MEKVRNALPSLSCSSWSGMIARENVGESWCESWATLCPLQFLPSLLQRPVSSACSSLCARLSQLAYIPHLSPPPSRLSPSPRPSLTPNPLLLRCSRRTRPARASTTRPSVSSSTGSASTPPPLPSPSNSMTRTRLTACWSRRGGSESGVVVTITLFFRNHKARDTPPSKTSLCDRVTL